MHAFTKFFALTATASLVALTAAAEDAKPLTRAEVEKIVEEVITQKPELIVNAFKTAQQAEMDKQLKQASEIIANSEQEIFNDPDSPVAGNPKGDVTVVEFFDYNCGYCRHLFKDLNQLLAEDKNVKVVFKEFPILSPTSTLAAKAGIAVHRLDPAKYFAYHQKLMEGSSVSEEIIYAAAESAGVTKDQLKTEMEKPAVEAALKKNRDLGAKLNVRGTPAMIINREMIPGAIDLADMKAKIKFARDQQ